MYSFPHFCLLSTILAFLTSWGHAFAPTSHRSMASTSTARHMMVDLAVPPPQVVSSMDPMTTSLHKMSASEMGNVASPMQQGIGNYLSRSSSVQVALQERKIPTKEEIEAKKRNFNFIFWGGGFVAPFLATIFYFGFKFWEK